MNKKFMSSNRRKKTAWFVILVMFFSMVPIDAIPVQAAEGEANSEMTVATGSAVEVESEKIVMELDDENKDEQGILYTLDETTLTAMVGTGSSSYNNSEYQGANDGIVTIPDVVEKAGISYDVRTIGKYAFYSSSYIKKLYVSDSVMCIAEDVFTFSHLEYLWLGKNVENWKTRRNSSYLQCIEVDEENSYYIAIEGVLYNRDCTEIIVYPCKKTFADTKTFYIPNSVTTIQGYCFANVRGLEYVVLPESVREIENDAFSYSTVKGINLEYVTNVEENAFKDSDLQWLIQGEDTVMSASALDSCSELEFLWRSGEISDLSTNYTTETYFPKINTLSTAIIGKETTMYPYEFRGITGLATLILSEDLKEIPKMAFYGCTALEKIYIPSSVEAIGESAFYQCSKLVIYGEEGSAAQTYAEDNFFDFVAVSEEDISYAETILYENDTIVIKGLYSSDCGKGKALEISTSYEECANITEVDVSDWEGPSSATSVPLNYTLELDENYRDEQGIFYLLDASTMTATVGRTYETSSSTKNSSMYGGKNSGHVIIPEYVRYNDNEYEVTMIGAHAFHGNEWIRTVSISDTVIEIDWASFVGAFSGCPNLYSVHIGARLSEFGSVTFSDTPCLRNITISEGNPYFIIQNEILYSADKTSAYKCFAKDGTQKIYVAEETTEIEENAFQNIDAEAVYLPENVKKIQPYAFQYSTIEYINLENITYIGEYAFSKCRNLKFLNLGSITSSARAFRDCYGAKVVYFKKGSTDDMTNAYNLDWIIYENSYPYSTSYENASNVKHVIFSETATQINFSCFTAMSKLEKLYIPESVTTIAGTPSTNNKSNLTIYAASGSAAHIYAQEQELNFVDMVAHTHAREEFVVYEDDYIKATGDYCDGCNTLKNFAVEIKEEGKYIAPEEETTEVTASVLDDENRDSYGIQYTLNENAKTATVRSNCGYSGANDGVVVLPDYVKKGDTVYMVTAIAINAFSDTSELRSLSISDTITTVQFPIVNAQTIEEIHLGANVNTWGSYNYSQLKKITVSLKNTTYYAKDNVLYNYDMTKLICYPAAKEGQVFEIPQKVSYIGEYAFRNTQLQQVEMNGIVTIYNNAFYNSAIKGVDLSTVTNVQTEAFNGCNDLEYAILSNSITVGTAFNNCESLSCVIMKKGSSLCSYDATKDLSTTSGSFENCPKLTCVVLPEDLTEIPANCFKNCTLLEKIYVPETVETISEYAFSGCQEDLTIYSSSVNVLRFAKNHFSYVQIKEHEHNFKEKTLFENDWITITGDCCLECEYITNCQTENGVVIVPTPTPTATPTVTPTVTPDESTEPTPETSSSPEVTATPTVTPTETPEVTPTATPTNSPKVPSKPTIKPSAEETLKTEVLLPAVTNFRVRTKDNKTITLTWKAVSGAKGYQIYRSRAKKKGYKLLATVSTTALQFTDKKVKKNKKYYYKVCAMNGKWSEVRWKSVNGMTAPKVKISKGKTGNIRYLTIHLKKYKGKYVQIYMKKKGKKFKKINLLYNKIKKYKGKFKLQYLGKKQKLYFKVRTYKRKGKKKIYSKYSKVLRVKT